MPQRVRRRSALTLSRLAISSAAAGALAAAALSCGDGTSPRSPALVASPSVVDIAEGTTGATVTLAAPSGRGSLSWHVTSLPDWLAADPTQGTLDGTAQAVTLRATLGGLTAGEHDGVVEVAAGGATTRVPVALHVSAAPVAVLDPKLVTIEKGSHSTAVTLTNAGAGTLAWSATTSAAWLAVAPASGTLAPGASAPLTATADLSALPPGLGSAEIRVRPTAATSPSATAASLVYVDVAFAPAAAVSPTSLEFPLGTHTLQFVLGNPGNGSLTWSASAASAAVTVSPSSGTLEQGGNVTIAVEADRSATSPYDDLATAVTVASNATNGSSSLAVPVVVRVVPPPNGADGVVDAEYDRPTYQAAIVFRDPARLQLTESRSGNTVGTGISLPLPPTCLAISPDGLFAVVGHDHALSYVDMRYPKVLQTFPVSVNVGDVVLPGDGYAYVIPAGAGDAAFHVIDLTSGAESVQAPVLAGSVARLHPSAGVTYVTNAATPSRIDKFATRSGSASLLSSSPTDRAVGGNLWLSVDGSRIFTARGDVLSSSSDPAQDMRWLATLPNVPDGVGAVAEVGGTSPMLLVAPALAPGATTSEVRAYDPATLALLGSAPLPRVIATDAAGLNHSYATEPAYLLAGDEYSTTVVVRAPAAMELAHPWVVGFPGQWTWLSPQAVHWSR